VNTDGKKVKKKKARPTVGAPAPSVPPLDLLRTVRASPALHPLCFVLSPPSARPQCLFGSQAAETLVRVCVWCEGAALHEEFAARWLVAAIGGVLGGGAIVPTHIVLVALGGLTSCRDAAAALLTRVGRRGGGGWVQTHESGELRTTAAPDAPVAMVVPATGATLSIAPAFLDWARQALCEPVELSVSVTNTARDQDLLVRSCALSQ
jgi:hypothetical protein